ncbi:pre-B-cell leukemia homeobox (Pbx) transcription factor [Oopsacas minuta]|uniref:Pre-B-cell leukemia homeobox (Pbx) transcription factor n=1 Tax=Oopsacas minuta TaxID=111878 RepID=A0AAV7KCQ3_9METZ|nr:pre-B-cell leukemia homeobox (Pbx) transcription factor [Oopsacas minuta]
MSNIDFSQPPLTIDNQPRLSPTRWREEADILMQCTQITLSDPKNIEQTISESPFSDVIYKVLTELYAEQEFENTDSLEPTESSSGIGGSLNRLEDLFEQKHISNIEEISDSSRDCFDEYQAKTNKIKQVYDIEHRNLKHLSDEYSLGILSVIKDQPKCIPMPPQYMIDDIVKGANERTQYIFLQLRTNVEEAVIRVKKNFVDGRPSKKLRRSFNKQATEILNEYFYSHLDNPYPSEEVKADLSIQCKITLSQINNWFGNKRIRYKRNIGKESLGDTDGLAPELHLEENNSDTCLEELSTSDEEIDNFNNYSNGFCM